MSFYDRLISSFPSVAEPKTHLSFKARLKWTAIVLLVFLFLGQITLYGISPASIPRLQFFELILGASLGTLMTLSIGPIVTASIILQLLVGSKIIPWDTKTKEGKKKFQGTQKLLAVFFSFFEAYAFVAFGAIQPASPSFFAFLVLQIAFGAILALFMDEVVSKWGIGSGISLFIAAGVTKQIFVRAFNPITPAGQTVPAGLIPQFVVFIGLGEVFQAAVAILPVIATILVFMIVVYIQAIKVEIPIAFGSVRGFSRRWPLNLMYTSNIPVILIGALVANLQFMATLMARPTEGGLRCGFLGCVDANGFPTSGFVSFLRAPSDLQIQIFFLTLLAVVFLGGFLAFYFRYQNAMKMLLLSSVLGFVLAILATNFSVGLPTAAASLNSVTYLLIFIAGSVIFSIFWVSTSGMDASTVAGQINEMGMSVPGFRRDPRIVEQVLNRYIPMLTILSGLLVGMLAALADFTNAIGTGTGILLTVSIVHNLYEQISMRYAEEMHPAMRQFFK